MTASQKRPKKLIRRHRVLVKLGIDRVKAAHLCRLMTWAGVRVVVSFRASRTGARESGGKQRWIIRYM